MEATTIQPFFILGAPRSGTTMLRDIFKQVEGLYSPEETHFFRWAAPFRGVEFNQFYRRNKILQKHREIDGVSDDEFFEIWHSSLTKAEFTNRYCDAVAQSKGAQSWFEKTPQNVYGLPLILRQYPSARIVHIVRHPYCVIKSLMEGKVMNAQSPVGAANYWYESVSIIDTMRPLMEDRLVEIKYEDIQADPDTAIRTLREQVLGGYDKPIDLSHIDTVVKDNKDYFESQHLTMIEKVCGEMAEHYGYIL